MQISVKVKLKKPETKVEKTGPGQYLVSINQPPVDNQANQALVKALADYFSVGKTKIKIIKGHKSKNKLIEIK